MNFVRRTIVGAWAGAPANVVRAHRRQVPRAAGFAVLVVTVTVAILAAVIGDFGYNARVDYEAAANARDQLRAEYAARSGVNLARLLIKVQRKFLDPYVKFIGDVQITQFVPTLMSTFLGGDDERKSMGDLLGVGVGAKGFGLGKGASAEVDMTTEDGKININCAGGNLQMQLMALMAGRGPAPPPAANGAGPAPGGPASRSPACGLYTELMSAMSSIRYNRMFETMTRDGQYITRDDVARAIIDWSDLDEAKFEAAMCMPGLPSSGGNEDYRYDVGTDGYKSHNHFYDTVEEVNLVHGVGDDFYGAFGSMFTVYGDCRINLHAISSENWPIRLALMRAAAVDPLNDPAFRDENNAIAVAQQIGTLEQMLPGGFTNDIASWAALAQRGGMPAMPQGANAQSPAMNMAMGMNMMQGLIGPRLDTAKLQMLAKVNERRRIYRIESTGSIARAGGRKIQVRITAIWDSNHYNNNKSPASVDANDQFGTWVYWRME